MAAKKKPVENQKNKWAFEILEDDGYFTVYLYDDKEMSRPGEFKGKSPYDDFDDFSDYEDAVDFVQNLKDADVFVTKKQTVKL